MEETKEHLKQLIDYFTGSFLTSRAKLQTDNELRPTEPCEKSGSSSKEKESVLVTSRNDINLIIKTLELCKKNLTHFTNSERAYLLPLMTLCGHVLMTETHLIPRTLLTTVSQLLIYILQFILNEISLYSEDESIYVEFNPIYLQKLKNIQLLPAESEEFYCYFLKYRLVNFLNFMLVSDENNLAQGSGLTDHDLVGLGNILRLKPMPDSLRFHALSSPAAATNVNTTSPSVKRIRLTTPGSLDRNSNEDFFDQLLTPFIVSNNTVPALVDDQKSCLPVQQTPSILSISEMNTSISGATASQITQVKSYLISHNQMYFQYIGGANTLLNLINNFTILRPYVTHLLAIEEGATLRLIKLDSNVFELVCDRIDSDIKLINQVFMLNRLLEPLSCDRVSKMIVIVQACLYASLTLISHSCQENRSNNDKEKDSSSNDKEKDKTSKTDQVIFSIIENCLNLYQNLFKIFRQSNRVAGQICQNAHMFTAWMLFSGLQIVLNNAASSKGQQGYNFLCIPLAKHALKLISYLLEDLHLEFGDQNDSVFENIDDADETDREYPTVDLLQEFNFLKKFSFSNQPQPQSSALSPSSSHSSVSSNSGTPPSGIIRTSSTTAASNVVTFKYNKFGHYSAWQRIEMIVSSNLNLIQLLFDYLSNGYRCAGLLRHSDWNPTDSSDANLTDSEEKFFDIDAEENEELFEAIGELMEMKCNKSVETRTSLENDIDCHYELVISILDHLNYYFICSKIDALQSYFKQMITDTQLMTLACIIQDLDYELANVQMYSPLSSKTFDKFSGSLTSLMHNLIAMHVLSESQQNSLLALLHFNPNPETESWGLYHGARSLAILAQIILLRQQKEKEDIKLDLNSITIQIWRGFIKQLKQASVKFGGEHAFFNEECPAYSADLNVEHAQLMLFLFHNLKLLQRKHVFSLLGNTIHEISIELNSSSKRPISAAQIMFIGRLLHLFEYMCKNLYDTPSYLFEQINQNLLILFVNRDQHKGFSKEDLLKIELDESIFSDSKYLDSLRNIRFFNDKKLESNYFSSIFANKDGTSLSSLTSLKSNQNNSILNFFDFILHPRFYHLMDTTYFGAKNTSARQFVPKLDGIACNFMLAGFGNLNYESFYSSLLELFQFIGYQYDMDVRSPAGISDSEEYKQRYPQFGTFGICSLDYTFQTMWRLINQLPPSLQSFTDIVTATEDDKPVDAALIVNMCIWLPRLENSRASFLWLRELLTKTVANPVNNLETLSESPTTTKSLITIEEKMNELLRKFGSLDFNYQLLKRLSWDFFHYNHCTNNQLFLSGNVLGHDMASHLLQLKLIQFPKFFTLFTIDLYMERVATLFHKEFAKMRFEVTESSSSSEDNLPSNEANYDAIEQYILLLLGLFDKIFVDINAVLVYDGPLSSFAEGQNSSSDLKYLFYRCLVNICSNHSLDSSLSDLINSIILYLPVNILFRIDQWNRLYANTKQSFAPNNVLMQLALFEAPLIALQPTSSGSSSKQTDNYLYSFSSFANEKQLLNDLPSVNSIETGAGNLTWIKWKQVWVKLFKFLEFIFSKKESYSHNHPFIIRLISMQLNLTFTSLSKNQDNQSSILDQVFNLSKSKDNYHSLVYPQIISNAYFFLTILKHPLFNELNDADQIIFQKTHQCCSIEFFTFFANILKQSAGKLAFEELLCDSTPATPTAISATSSPDCSIFTSSGLNFNFMDLIEVAAHPLSTPDYAFNLLKVLKTLMSQADKYPDDISILRLCSGLSSALLDNNDRVNLLYKWINCLFFHRRVQDESNSDTEKNSSLTFVAESTSKEIYTFYKFIFYAVKDSSRFEEVVLASFAEALLPNVQKLLSDTLVDSENFLSFAGLFSSLVFLMSASGNTDDSMNSFGKPCGHFKLINETISWLTLCKDYLSKKEVIRKIEQSVSNGRHRFILESCYQMLSYLSDVFNALEYRLVYLKSKNKTDAIEDTPKEQSSKSPKVEQNSGPIFIDDLMEYDNGEDENEDRFNYDDFDDDDDDDDEDEDFCNQLCTFTVTQKEFINQHWYHCHTCKMIEGVGACTICAKVCHRGHDVTYSKHGSFFCDCGASETMNCKALEKRQPSRKKIHKPLKNLPSNVPQVSKSIIDKKKSVRMSKYWYSSLYTSDFKQWKLSDNFKMSKNKFANKIITSNFKKYGLEFENIENFSSLMLNFVAPISDSVLALVEYFVPSLEDFFYQHSELGFLSTIRKEFSILHSGGKSSDMGSHSIPLSIEKCEQMMAPIKCLPDILFENVQVANEQSQSQYRSLSLITGAVVKRVSMLVLGTSLSCDQSSLSTINSCLLLVAHDKCRITVVQLNHLLGQLYLNVGKKLPLQRLSAISFPFTIMTMAHNPLNDELIAVCGLKECHILTLARSGAITAHYSLSITLDTNNHIIKAMWLPNSQTELAIVTLDFIKIFDLSSEDRETPIYNFTIPSRKIRDMTVFCSNEDHNSSPKRAILIFSSRGQIYAQELNSGPTTVAQPDLLYVTTILNVTYPESWSSSSQQTMIGYSIYYSHLLQMLFVSYLNGNSFCAPFNYNNIYTQQISNVTSLDYTSSSASESSSPSSNLQPLFQWNEVLSHPGLVFAITVNSNWPVCFMVKSGSIAVQEIKLRKKALDIVAVCTMAAAHVSDSGLPIDFNTNKSTTLISLCEDGSLRFHYACNEYTNFWMKPNFLNHEDLVTYSKSTLPAALEKQSSKSKSSSKSAPVPSAVTPKFPIDFFEHCTQLNDIEFGGSDVLEVYNTQQIKNRLNSSNMYIACTKPNGFTIIVTYNGNSDLVLAGCRVNLGVCDPTRAPIAIEVFGRMKPVAINRQRWFDIPFTKAEMRQLASTKTFNIRFSSSVDSNHITIVDSIKVYGRSRSYLGLDDEPTSSLSASATSAQGESSSGGNLFNELRPPLVGAGRMVSNTFIKSSNKKIRFILYAPTITDDEFISNLTNKQQGILVLNRLLANCLDVLEGVFAYCKTLSEATPTSNPYMLMSARDMIHTPEYQQKCDTALSISSKLLTISLSNRLDRSICMLMSKLLPNRLAYDEHRDEVIFENAIENLKHLAYDDIIVFCYNLSLFREMISERPKNFVRFIAKYFIQSNDLAASSMHFSNYLSDLFWRLYLQRPPNELVAPLTKVSLFNNLDTIVDSLVYSFYKSMFAIIASNTSAVNIANDSILIHEQQQKIITKTAQLITQLLCSTDPQISYATKKALVKILSVSTISLPHQKSSKPSTSKRERRYSGHHSSSESASTSSARPSTSTDATPSRTTPFSRVGAIRRHAPGSSSRRNDSLTRIVDVPGISSSGADQSAASILPIGAGSSNSDSNSVNVFRQVSQLLGTEFASYQNVFLTLPMEDIEDQTYLNELFSSNLAASGLNDEVEIYENEDDEEEDEDDDDDDEEEDDDDDELDMTISIPEGNSISAPPPLFPVSFPLDNYLPNNENANASGASNQIIMENEDGEIELHVNEDDDDEDDDDDDEDEEDYEAMDEDEMMEIAIALSLQEQQLQQEQQSNVSNNQAASNPNQESSIQLFNRLLYNFNSDFQSISDNQEESNNQGNLNTAEQPSSSTQPPQPAPQQQPSQSDYPMLHSESDEEDEELFDDEMKIHDATVELIDPEEDDDEDEELNSIDASASCANLTSSSSAHSQQNLKSTRSISKSNEAITQKRPTSSNAALLSVVQTNLSDSQIDKSAVGPKSSCARHKKKLKRLVASKFSLALLKQMSSSVETIMKMDGIQSIPYFQVLTLLSEFKYAECDQKEFAGVFTQLLSQLLKNLFKTSHSSDESNILSDEQEVASNSKKLSASFKDRVECRPDNEVLLLIMRFISLYMSYFKCYSNINWQLFLQKDLQLNVSGIINSALITPEPTTADLIQQPSSSRTVKFDEQSISQNVPADGTAASITATAVRKDRQQQIHQSLLFTATQLFISKTKMLNLCYVLLQQLLRHHWLQQVSVDSCEEDKSKSESNNSIEYHSKNPIKIRPHLNFIPGDLKPFFVILPETQSSGTLSAASSALPQQAAHQARNDTSGVTVANVTCNRGSNSSSTCTALNSIIFSNHVFDRYAELLTEMSLRLPYQLKKLITYLNSQSKQLPSEPGKDDKSLSRYLRLSVPIEFEPRWIEILCHYMMLPSVTPYIRKQVRKLLLNLCGSKERYRQVRDYYAIKSNLREVRQIIVTHFFSSDFKLQELGFTEQELDNEEQLDELIKVIINTTFVQDDDKAIEMISSEQHRLLNLPYSQLISLVDYLKACLDIANARTANWQKLCRVELRILPFLFRISLLFGEGVSTIILQLLSMALFNKESTASGSSKTPSVESGKTFILSDKLGTELDKSTSHSSVICCHVFSALDRQLLNNFIRYFLLESNSTHHRWVAHSLLYRFYQLLQPNQQEVLLSLFWQLWPVIPFYGKRASQFVDLLGYFTLKTSRNSTDESSSRTTELEHNYIEAAVGLLRYQNQIMAKHPNSNLYNSLQTLLEFNDYYMETEPCLVCNNPEVNFTPVKLSSIKLDSRFTANTQIVKLIGAHTISKITVKISDIKRTKMVKTLSIYYNNRWVQSVVELKNKNTVWQKAKRIQLAPSQPEVKIEFTLPIVACNLMIEYSSFYESASATTETIQCPRCSSVVPTTPGVCSNCGENVFQCHKCRAINYDEKDPFLCNSCGFCKYARFEYILTARYTASAVETIKNEEDRSKAVHTINSLLEKADRLYKLILGIRPSLEKLLLCSLDYHTTTIYGFGNDSNEGSAGSGNVSSTSGNSIVNPTASIHVNRYIHLLANQYGTECRLHFEELSKIVQKVLYTRKELVDYDNRQNGTRHNMEVIRKMLLEQNRLKESKVYSGSTAGSSSSSSTSTLIENSTPAVSKAQSMSVDEVYLDGKKKLSFDETSSVDHFKSGRCYGCSSATIEHCITLLKALAYTPRYKAQLSSSTLFHELIDYNLRLGSKKFRNEVRSLLCLLTRDNSEATEEFNNLLLEKIRSALQTRYMTSFDFGSVRHEIALLAASFENEDLCWEQRLRCVMKLFLLSLQNKSPAVLEAITLPCIRILYNLIVKPSADSNAKSAESIEQLTSIQSGSNNVKTQSTTIPFNSLMINVSVDLAEWLKSDTKSSFSSWHQRNVKIQSDISDQEKIVYEEQIQRKYFSRWLYLYQSGKLQNLKCETFAVRIVSSTWIQDVLFNPTSKALRIACRQLLMALFERLSNKQRVLIDLFTSFLDDLCQVGGETGLEFYDLYRSIVFNEFSSTAKSANLSKSVHWRYYLTLCGLLKHLGQLISIEIDRLKELEETTLSSDFSQGSTLRQLVELLQLFMRDERIRRIHKSSMVGFVLDGYLSLRKLVVQRTKMIDETQASLLELLELLTTGTKDETINFMKVCIESVKKCSVQDLRTPVFIFERLCSMIRPEEKDAGEFFISLEKDPQQEDFLQGRMLGNPYSSKDPGMGPLMRDIKNKICQECELVSLLEDDSSLELLVNNKIISLDLPVKEVHKRIVCADANASGASSSANSWSQAINSNIHSESAESTHHGHTSSIGPSMKIIYRIRGLMGDATEEFIETLNSKESVVQDDEKLFELANIMSAQSSGLQVMLERMEAIQEINNRSRSLLIVILKLFGYCVRVKSNRRALITPELNAIGIMLRISRLFLKTQSPELLTSPSAPGEPSYFEQLLSIMETILLEASKESQETFDRFNQETCGTCEDIKSLMNSVSSPTSIIFTSNNSALNAKILRIVAFLSMGHEDKMSTLISFFKPYFDFDEYDKQNAVDDAERWFELFCALVSVIETNKNGDRLKDRLIEEKFVLSAVDYLVRNAPPMKNFLLLNSEEWKEFTSKPALKYVLRMLTGLSHGHENTQLLLTKDAIPVIHGLEQVLTDSHMATLAENLMEAIKENPSVAAKIQEVRLRTREEKKRLAMAVREKQLDELGMRANDKGQVMASSQLLKQMEEQLSEEKGLICSICREGYAYQPQKVLAIYTFTKRCNVEEFEERKTRKTLGYTTVTHFNIVHVECHLAAVRHARSRDEWQSALLHNTNTRCNGLLPLWGPQVYESLFAHALSRYNSYLQDAVGQRDFVANNSFLGTIHDLKLLLLKFATGSSFSEETGGGGAQSNLYLTPYLAHCALYVINTTKVAEREMNNLKNDFLNQSSDKWIESCFQVESAYYYSTIVLLLHSQQFWDDNRLMFLRRLIFSAHVRSLPSDSRDAATIETSEISYATIKPALTFFSLINLFYTVMFKTVETKSSDPTEWPLALANYIRHNDQAMLESADKMLDQFENDLLPSSSFGEFCDAADLLRGTNPINDPEQFLRDALKLN